MKEKYENRSNRIKERNDKIRNDYSKLANKKMHGQKIYTQAVMFAMLAKKYYLSLATIEDIVFFNDKNSKRAKDPK